MASMSNATPPVAPDLTVVVPTVGGPHLEGCLASLHAGSMWPARVVVVDQSVTAAAAGWVADLQAGGLDALHLSSEPRGIAAGTNRGLAEVNTPFVAITHDDCVVGPDWVERLAGRLRAAGDTIVTGRVEPEGDGIVLTVKTDDRPVIHTAPLLNGDVLFPPNMGFPVHLLQRVGAFDEHPSLKTAGEDNEWAHRALRAGVPIAYDPTIVVGHLARHTPEDLPALYLRYARGQGAFYGCWLRRRDPFIVRRVVRDLIRAPWLLLRGLITWNRELIAMGRGEVLGLLPGILAGLRNPGVRV
jgi:GT2 family glycosyltransferase